LFRPRNSHPSRPPASSPRSEGGFFKAEIKFPDDFPNSPPEMRFVSEMWHPNGAFFSPVVRCTFSLVPPRKRIARRDVAGRHAARAPTRPLTSELLSFPAAVYPDGKVCISILHAPGVDRFNLQVRTDTDEGAHQQHSLPSSSPPSPHSCRLSVRPSFPPLPPFRSSLPLAQETADERWRPILGVEQVLVSVMSMLSEPNCDSPANIDAGKMLRDNPKEYRRRVRKTVEKTLDG
jgi:ubiquitin-protein ligase